jgi:hypothetical protein
MLAPAIAQAWYPPIVTEDTSAENVGIVRIPVVSLIDIQHRTCPFAGLTSAQYALDALVLTMDLTSPWISSGTSGASPQHTTFLSWVTAHVETLPLAIETSGDATCGGELCRNAFKPKHCAVRSRAIMQVCHSPADTIRAASTGLLVLDGVRVEDTVVLAEAEADVDTLAVPDTVAEEVRLGDLDAVAVTATEVVGLGDCDLGEGTEATLKVMVMELVVETVPRVCDATTVIPSSPMRERMPPEIRPQQQLARGYITMVWME